MLEFATLLPRIPSALSVEFAKVELNNQPALPLTFTKVLLSSHAVLFILAFEIVLLPTFT